ncbi:glycoside hydrolase family 2 protein [Lanmaoa asiatica]|nr:glycoside hydrolase family 2 protein [Lanmaoa asiatica]
MLPANSSIVVPASLPSQAHIDLFNAGVINDPLLGINEYTERWVVNDNWTYTADLTLFVQSFESGGSERILLLFYGRDTIANITFAGHPVAWVNNQFRRYTYDVSSYLESPIGGDNNLTIVLESACSNTPTSVSGSARSMTILGGIRFLHSCPAAYISLRTSSLLSEFDTLLESPKDPTYPRISNTILLYETRAHWFVYVTFGVRSVKSYAKPNRDTVDSGARYHIGAPHTGLDCGGDRSDDLRECEMGSVHRMGHYDAFIHADDQHGFRTVQLMQTAYSEEEIASRGITPGDQWHFEIDGKAFCSKGTNIIPFDPFYTRINPEAVRWVLGSAVQSGQNMLRVWGGGVYQPSDAATDGGLYDFYSLCDELGILAWSELMFSDGLYPVNSFVLEAIEPEVRQNVRRVNRHPSNAQWAGGNEIEGIVLLVNASVQTSTHCLDEFVYLLQDYLHSVVLLETNSVPYIDCSTTHGVLILDPYVLRFENGTPGYVYGNTERYNYDATHAFNLSTYSVSRFRSMPSLYTWKEVLENPEDFAFNSTRPHLAEPQRASRPILDDERCGTLASDTRHIGHQPDLCAVVLEYAALPIHEHDRGDCLVQTQCRDGRKQPRQSGLAAQRHLARRQSVGDRVFWEVESTGLWIGERIWAGDHTAVLDPKNETLTVLATSDRWESVDGVAQLTRYDWSGRVLNTSTRAFSIPSLSNSLVYEGTGLATIIPAGYDAPDVWLLMNLTAQADNETVTNESYVSTYIYLCFQGFSDADHDPDGTDQFTPVSLAYANLVDLKIVVSANNNYTFTLSA